MGPIWGIDLGGTKIEGVVLEDSSSFNILKRLRLPTESQKGYDHIVGQIAKLVEVLSGEIGVKPSKIGICTPGVMDPILHTLKNSNTTCLNGKPLQQDIQEALGIEVVTANDANCFALAETKFGIVQDIMPEAQVTFGVIMGTGVGGGLVVNGSVINGRHGIGGEWGHNFLHESGGDCYCGDIGCVETVLSGPSLQKFYRGMSKESLSMQEIMERYHQNEEAAMITVNRLLKYFGKGISSIVNMIDPDVIMIGGGVGNIDLLYDEGIRQVKKHIFNHRLDTHIVKPKLGDSAGVYGAALL